MNVDMPDKGKGHTKNEFEKSAERSQWWSRRTAFRALKTQKHSSFRQQSSSASALTPNCYYVNEPEKSHSSAAPEGMLEELILPSWPWTLAAERRGCLSLTGFAPMDVNHAGTSLGVTCSVQHSIPPLNNQHSLSEGPLSTNIQSAATRPRSQPPVTAG